MLATPSLVQMPEPPKFCPHAPHPRQAVFLGLATVEALYGGAAGGGKSDALLMAALQYVHVPGYSALILRKSYADLALPDAIMDRAKTWLMGIPGVNWNDQRKVFTFPSGATLTFGYLKYVRDRYRYQGSAYQFIGFDEATQFNRDEYLYLFSRLRRPAVVEGKDNALAKVPLRIRCASNPGGIGHEWVRDRFVPQVDPYTDKLVIPANEQGEPRVFIPAKLRDNPSLDASEYEKNLKELDPVLRAQLLDGDWGARPPGEMFDRNWFRVVITPQERAAVLMRCSRFGRFWDFASTEESKKSKDPDWTVGVLMARTAEQEIVILDVRRVRARPNDVERLVLETAIEDAQRYGCRMIRNEKEPGSAGEFVAQTMAKKLAGYDYLAVRSTGPKTERARPFSTYAANGLVLVMGARWNAEFLSEYEAFPMAGVHDDQVDAGSLGFSQLISTYYSGSGAVNPTKQSYAAPRRTTVTYTQRRERAFGARR